MDAFWELLSWGRKETAPREIPLIVSMCYYALLAVIGRTLRTAVRINVATRWQPYLMDAITGFQLLSWSLENTQIRRFYGEAAYVGILFTLGMWSFLTIEGSSANPCYHMLKYMKNQQSGRKSCVRVTCQLAGGLLSFQYARQFWRLGLHAGHSERFASLHCVTDLNVSPTAGFAVEFFATMFEATLAMFTFTSFYICEVATKCFISCYMVLLGVHLTGMYMNPINATNQSFGCRGTTVLEHLFVYWVAPLSAAAISVKLHGLLGNRPASDHKTENGVKATEVETNQKVKVNGVSGQGQAAEYAENYAGPRGHNEEHNNNGIVNYSSESTQSELKFRKNVIHSRDKKA